MRSIRDNPSGAKLRSMENELKRLRAGLGVEGPVDDEVKEAMRPSGSPTTKDKDDNKKAKPQPRARIK